MDITQIVEGGIYTVKQEQEDISGICFVVAKINKKSKNCSGFPGLFFNSKFSYMVNNIENHRAEAFISHIGNVGDNVLKDIKEIANDMI